MNYAYFSYNGKLLPTSQAVVPLANIEYAYGFGVYKTIRVIHGVAGFLPRHSARLLESAKIIGLEHTFKTGFIEAGVKKLIDKNQVESCNVKVMLIGGPTAKDATLYMQCLAPQFPDRKLYTSGAHFITYRYEREFPRAKTLNMLQSYLAYRQARLGGAYDALLVNQEGVITEGTRTNFLAIKGNTIISHPEEQVLPGIMREAVLDFARHNSYLITYQAIKQSELAGYDGAFVTSTTSKILPIKSIDGYAFGPVPSSLRRLMDLFKAHLDESRASSGNSPT